MGLSCTINLCAEVTEVSFCIPAYKVQLFFPHHHYPLHHVLLQGNLLKEVLTFLLGVGFTGELQIRSPARSASPKPHQIQSRGGESFSEPVSMGRLSARWEENVVYCPEVPSWAQPGCDWWAQNSFELLHSLRLCSTQQMGVYVLILSKLLQATHLHLHLNSCVFISQLAVPVFKCLALTSAFPFQGILDVWFLPKVSVSFVHADSLVLTRHFISDVSLSAFCHGFLIFSSSM